MQIGTVKIESKLALAPMAGVTDAAFRQICSELGAGYTVTELVSAKALCYHDAKTAQLLRPFPGEKPFAAQIFGSDETCMAEAAQMALEISGASEAAVFFCAATDYDMKFPKYRTETEPSAVTKPLLHTAERLGWDALYEEHYTDYSSMFSRVSLDLGEERELPADKLLEAYRAGDKSAMRRLETLYFSYGRYLLISSSREA